MRMNMRCTSSAVSTFDISKISPFAKYLGLMFAFYTSSILPRLQIACSRYNSMSWVQLVDQALLLPAFEH
jgi:hypothetical protein